MDANYALLHKQPPQLNLT